MLLSGFTIIRNGEKFAFPYLESIQSVLSICDEFVINVGNSEDETLQRLLNFQSGLPKHESVKLKIFSSEWPLNDTQKRRGGLILSEQTNLALKKCQAPWCLYLQADELLHENDLPKIRPRLMALQQNTSVEALVFNYFHFYGNYNTVQTSRSSYRREIRVIRNGLDIQSTGDAQSFKHADGRKLKAVLLDVPVYHYGWVRPPHKMREKTAFMDTLYHHAATINHPATGSNYLYKRMVCLKPFLGSHPKVIHKRINTAEHFSFDTAPKVFHIKDIWKLTSSWIEEFTGIRLFEYKNYKLLKL